MVKVQKIMKSLLLKITCVCLTGILAFSNCLLPVQAKKRNVSQEQTAMHRISVRQGDGRAEFYDTVTGETFHPIGSSYIKLHVNEKKEVFHANFTDELYNPEETDAALKEMRKYGYNIVRVWLYHGHFKLRPIYSAEGPASTDVADLYKPYMDNFLDFLEKANENNIYVYLAIDRVPQNEYYLKMVNDGYPQIEGMTNREYMVPGAIEAKEIYIDKIMEAIKKRNPDLLNTIFAFEIRNEINSTTANGPFNKTEGIVETAAGSYDMADPASRQACQDDNVTLFLNRCVDRIKSHDPDALTTSSVFTFDPVGKTGMAGTGLLPVDCEDQRWPIRPEVLIKTKIDFIDIHNYYPWKWMNGLKSIGWESLDKSSKPFIAGEFGAHRTAFSDVNDAAQALFDYRQDILDSGFQGALLFTWDETKHTRWTMEEEGGIIKRKLSPNNEEFVCGLSPLHRIGIRKTIGMAEFYDTVTGETFHPIGSTYLNLYVKDNGSVYHADFAVGQYDADAAEAALKEMHKYGYNTVRVWLYHGSPSLQPIMSVEGPQSTNVPDLYKPYMDNFLDFLEKANENNIYVYLAIDRFPQNEYYLKMANGGYPQIEGATNREYMVPGAIEAKEIYIDKIMETIKGHNPDLLSTILAFEIRNELHSTTAYGPFNKTEGIVETAAGSYNMADPASRQACQDDNVTLFLNRCVDRIKSHDPDALTTSSVFTFDPVRKTGMAGAGLLPVNCKDKRWPVRPEVLLKTKIDFVDIHNYYPWDWKSGLKSIGWESLDKSSKPFFAGEFGAHRTAFPNAEDAAQALYDYRQDILDSGFQGALLFTWDETKHTRWTMEEQGGAIKRKLSPDNMKNNEENKE